MMLDSFATIPPDLIDHFPAGHDGYSDRCAAEDTPDALWDACGSASTKFSDDYWIEPKDWPDAARDNDKYRSWAMNFVDRYTWQKSSHECTSHSLRALGESSRNRQRGVFYKDGPKKGFRYPESATNNSVWLSPLSIYAEANPRQWGGASIRGVLSIAIRRGFLPSKTQPRDYGFKHQLHDSAGGGEASNQSIGPWTPVSRFPSGWQETAKHFRPLEVIFPESWEQAVCLVLHGIGIGVGRSGHAIPWMQALFDSRGNFTGLAYPDSYLVTRVDSAATVRSAWRGSYGIASFTAPDDWERPAG